MAELERELQETRDFLRSLQEQHEEATEELQASAEEIQSANEELQSINEELETSKEELESSNEELITTNDEMIHRNGALDRLNADLNNLQASAQMAILLLGLDLTIRRFTPQAEKAFNLIAADIGRPLSGIKCTLEFPHLESFARQSMETAVPLDREVKDRDGRWHSLRAQPYRTLDNKIDGVVLSLVDIDGLKLSEQKIQAACNYAEGIVRTARDPLIVLRADFCVNTANEGFTKHSTRLARRRKDVPFLKCPRANGTSRNFANFSKISCRRTNSLMISRLPTNSQSSVAGPCF